MLTPSTNNTSLRLNMLHAVLVWFLPSNHGLSFEHHPFCCGNASVWETAWHHAGMIIWLRLSLKSHLAGQVINAVTNINRILKVYKERVKSYLNIYNKNLHLPPIHPMLGWLLHHTHTLQWDIHCCIRYRYYIMKTKYFQIKKLMSQWKYREG